MACRPGGRRGEGISFDNHPFLAVLNCTARNISPVLIKVPRDRMANIEPISVPAVRLDLEHAEKVVVTVFWGFLCVRLAPGVFESGEYLSILLLLSEAFVVFLVVLRR